MKVEDCYGRLFTKDQVDQEVIEQAQLLPSMIEEKGKLFCNRCGSQIDLEHWKLQIGSYYCRACIQLGRIRGDEPLYYFPQVAFPQEEVLNWQGTLTPFQSRVSEALVQSLGQENPVMVHAVTGAGKTEMMYHVVAEVIRRGESVCIATPRIDVCIELYHRMTRDFTCPISLLHGDSEPYFRTPLVIATTHQLLKFYQAFNLLIIDEVDAFPFVDNAMLYQAVSNALAKKGKLIYLTATSTKELDRKVKNKELKRVSLPRRFHGNPLVVPKKVWLQDIRRKIEKEQIPRKLLTLIKQQRKTHYPLILFVSEIKLGEKMLRILRKLFPNEKLELVTSKTENRLELVEGFRNQEISILLSTTILERGVTFPKVDVFVIEANHRLFTKSALVQIAGRVGRSIERPTGTLLYLSEGTSKDMNDAIREIKEMNKEAGF